MRFDDRLLTVLNQPADDRHDAAVRWRQLVDLVARAGPNADSPVVTEALAAIKSEASRVEEGLRAAAARAVAALPLPLGLLEYFASDSLAVSAPVLAAASLDAGQWRVLHEGADDETRRFIASVHPDLKTQANPEPAAEPTDTTAPELPPGSTPSLHDVVERIERRRRLRSGQPRASAGAPPEGSPPLFRWECSPNGEIAWVEGVPRGPLIGRSIAKPQDEDGDRVDAEVLRAFRVRAPFRDGVLTIGGSGPVSGEWKISGVPAFEPADGRFAGYRGVALRETVAPIAATEQPAEDLIADPDSLRELVHEIKTPLNAIIGFAEIIQGQYLGPADRGYRDRAGEIVRQGRLLLTGIDDLDFAAKIHSAAGSARERVDLAALIGRTSGELGQLAGRGGVQVQLDQPRYEVAARVEPELADRLLFRLVTTVAEAAEAGEKLYLSAATASDGPRVSISRPNALRGLDDAELFDGGVARSGVQAGFMLRLARGLARIAGGDLIASRDSLALVFPRA